jgi:hypothetical protein
MIFATTYLSLATTMIWLTFFPTESHRDWIGQRAARTLEPGSSTL